MRLVLCAEGPAEPMAALRHYLHERPPTEDDPVHLVFGMRRTPPPDLPGLARGLTVGTFLPGRGLRAVPDVQYHRHSYSEICHSLTNGTFVPDTVIACATPPGADGVRSLGAVNGYLDLALRVARHVVLEEVDWLPRVPGAAAINKAAEVVSTDLLRGASQPGFSADADADDIDLAVARNVASLIPRDARLALGIGRVSDAVVTELIGRRDVSILTGVVTDAVRAMHESTGTADTPVQAMSVVGSEELLRWSESSGAVVLRPSTEIHEPSWLSQHDRFVAVLGALQIDHAGNLGSERAAAGLVSGLGGAPDFARGAHESQGGRAIVALSSTHRSRSRLVETVTDPTVPARWVDAVVTEHGTAVLAGLGPDERRRALGAIF
jgi:acyl-CoA hydrolase